VSLKLPGFPRKATEGANESLAVTVLAFIFIPISLASSIFGMNVQQINESGPEIWNFLYTSLVLWTLSALSFFLRHTMKRFWVRNVDKIVLLINGLPPIGNMILDALFPIRGLMRLPDGSFVTTTVVRV
jgi:uncharacterized membrane protein